MIPRKRILLWLEGEGVKICVTKICSYLNHMSPKFTEYVPAFPSCF